MQGKKYHSLYARLLCAGGSYGRVVLHSTVGNVQMAASCVVLATMQGLQY